jgi:hypothetical protein
LAPFFGVLVDVIADAFEARKPRESAKPAALCRVLAQVKLRARGDEIDQDAYTFLLEGTGARSVDRNDDGRRAEASARSA